MKKKILILLTLVAVIGIGAILSNQVKAGDETHYSFNITTVNASDGSFISTGPLTLQTQSELKTTAEGASTSGSTVLIGSGGDEYTPVTDIQIVGIGGVAYGNIVRCVPAEE